MTKIYAFGFNDYLLSILKHILFAVISGYLFFHSFYAVIILLLFYPFTLRNEKKNKRKKDEIKLNSEFIDALNSLSSAFEAGYAAENAFRESVKDLRLIYGEKDMILKEFTNIENKLGVGVQLDTALQEFADETEIADIESFAEVFVTARKTGGNMIHVLRNTCNMLTNKQEVKNEIRTNIAEKKLESDIMKYVPYGILIYFHICAYNFIAPLYESLRGGYVMVFSFITCIFLGRLADRLTDIEV